MRSKKVYIPKQAVISNTKIPIKERLRVWGYHTAEKLNILNPARKLYHFITRRKPPVNIISEQVDITLENIKNSPENSILIYDKNKCSSAFFDMYYKNTFNKNNMAILLINVGPGSFKHPRWKLMDKLYQDDKSWVEFRRGGSKQNIDFIYDLLYNQIMPFDDNSVDAFYCSHLIEHVYNDNVLHFFNEVYRTLKRGGVFRISAPDVDLMIRAFESDDPYYFSKYNFVDKLSPPHTLLLKTSENLMPFKY